MDCNLMICCVLGCIIFLECIYFLGEISLDFCLICLYKILNYKGSLDGASPVGSFVMVVYMVACSFLLDNVFHSLEEVYL